MVARRAARRAARLEPQHAPSSERWLRFACRVAPDFDSVHRALSKARRQADDRLGALAVAQWVVRRFERSGDAWLLLGEAYLDAFRPRDALVAFERALQIEERSDAAMAAGVLYRREGDLVTAGARFARAYAAGGGPDALLANAEALHAAGDVAAAAEARALWERETGRAWED